MARHSRWFLVALTALAVTTCKRSGHPPDVDSQVTTLGQGGEGGHHQRPLALRPLKSEELTPDIIDEAEQILKQYGDQPLGYEVPFELAGRRYVARLEQHYHPPGSSEGPIGEHLGVTVYVLE
jgi:hypothetical protein